jgi:uncharacterized membrane protein
MKILMIVSYLIYIAMAIWRIVQEVELKRSELCTLPVFIFSGIVDCLVAIMFLIIGCQLKKIYRKALDDMEDDIEENN